MARIITAVVVLVAAPGLGSSAFSPYQPAAGWTYYLEAARQKSWPQCQSRFVSSHNTDSKAILGSTPGKGAELSLETSHTNDGAFYLRLSNGRYLSYAGPCTQRQVDTWPQAGINQEFRLVTAAGSVSFEWALQAVGRAECPENMVSFAYADCSDAALVMAAAGSGNHTRFRSHAVRSSSPTRYDKPPNSQAGCADPFAWHSSISGAYQLVCTGGNLQLFKASSPLSPRSGFAVDGLALGGRVPGWASSGNRWAPENIEFSARGTGVDINSVTKNASTTTTTVSAVGQRADDGATTMNVVFFSDSTGESGKHRVGWAMSSAAEAPLRGSWKDYSPSYMDLGNSAAGEIDQHIFRDTDGKTYLLWKTDDNSVGSQTTRLWGQEVLIAPGNVTLVGGRHELMDSSGLWWVESFVAGGSLIEGPELVHRGGYYYLFFAAGKYCQTSYSEGVARAPSIWGPYEKMPVALLSTGLTGYTNGQKQVGPGHASFVLEAATSRYFSVYHASPGQNCDRHAFVEEMRFDDASTKWPYIWFGAT